MQRKFLKIKFLAKKMKEYIIFLEFMNIFLNKSYSYLTIESKHTRFLEKLSGSTSLAAILDLRTCFPLQPTEICLTTYVIPLFSACNSISLSCCFFFPSRPGVFDRSRSSVTTSMPRLQRVFLEFASVAF